MLLTLSFFLLIQLLTAKIIRTPTTQSECGIRHFDTSKKQFLVTDGERAETGEFPWVVSIHSAFGPYCTGTIISERHVLTAAHCVTDGLSIIAGTNDYRDKNAQNVAVEHAIAHEKFDYERASSNDYNDTLNDIGILCLKEPLVFSDTVQPICLPQKETKMPPDSFIGRQAAIAGWGWYKPDKSCHGDISGEANLLHKGSVSVVPCGVPTKMNHAEAFEICAHGEVANVQHGDSGSGLLISEPKSLISVSVEQWTQIGITSWGAECDPYSPKFPEEFTYVQPYCDWIEQKTGILCP